MIQHEFSYEEFSVLADIRVTADDDFSIEYISVMDDNGRDIDFDYLPQITQDIVLNKINDWASERCHELYYEQFRDDWSPYDD